MPCVPLRRLPSLPGSGGCRIVCRCLLACCELFVLHGLIIGAVVADDEAASPGWIGYTEGRNDLPGGQFENWITQRACLVRADGTQRKVLAEDLVTEPHSWSQFAGWSPDGRVAIIGRHQETPENAAWEREHKTFRMTEGWLSDVILLEPESGQARNVTGIERVSNYNSGLFFLPDGKGFGFTALIEGISRPWIMDAAGRNKCQIAADQGGFAYGYSVSPDGGWISYHENYQIIISKSDGSERIKVETGQPFNFVPQWSPDGQWLLFVSGQHYDCHPTIVHRDGTQLRKLADRGGYRGVVERLKHPDFHSESSDVPVWASDGMSVFYTAKVGECIELMHVTLDGVVRQLTHSSNGVRHYHPSPSPDHKGLLFGSDRSSIMQLYVMNLAEGSSKAVTNVPAGFCAMHGHWRPTAKSP
jgi:TolB protein